MTGCFGIGRAPVRVAQSYQITPQAAGFSVYTLHSLPEDLAQVLETNLFKPLDTCADLALGRLLQPNASLDENDRFAWSKFLVSINLRHPDDIAKLREEWPKDLKKPSPEDERAYSSRQSEPNHPSLAELMSLLRSDEIDLSLFNLIVEIIERSAVAQHLVGMKWALIKVTKNGFLTGDRPIVRTNSLTEPNDHLALPLSPKVLFLAANNQDALHRISGMREEELVDAVNLPIVQKSRRFVFSQDEELRDMIDREFGRFPEVAVTEIVFRRRSEAEQGP